MRALAVAAMALALIAARDRDPLAGRVAGTPVECIDLDRVGGGPAIQDDGTLLYQESGRRTWRASVGSSCPRRHPFDTVIVEVYGRRLCANDRFRVLEAGTSIPSAYCRFGAFTPFDKPAAIRR